ncbi:hypothetical protein AB0N06_12785 [Streptomyces sp. NPDC051020]|uniref:hypothetical protein n=1 Tax=Streptomyces sp. NPDC051020 TaxID=3155409 RepID=UPI0034368719
MFLLVVLAVVGGASAAVAAAGAVTPPRSLSGPSPAAAHTAVVPPSAQHTDRTTRPGHPHDTRQTDTATSGHDRTALPAVPRPWVATDHIRIQHQLPPPGPGGALLPGTPGILVPLPARQRAPDTPSFAADPLRVALPGVRGPPRTDRFPGHRSARQT